jgi:hypothetical protein
MVPVPSTKAVTAETTTPMLCAAVKLLSAVIALPFTRLPCGVQFAEVSPTAPPVVMVPRPTEAVSVAALLPVVAGFR